MENVTQKFLAQFLQVSQTTISRAVNNSPLLKTGTRKRILAQIEELNYVPNSLAKALRGGKTNTVAIVLPYFGYLEGYNTARIVSGIGTVAASLGYRLIVTAFSGFLSESKILQKIIQEKRLDGIFAIHRTKKIDRQFLNFVYESKTPFIFVNSNRQEKKLYSVGSDNFGGVYRATNYLIGKGCRRILFLGEDSSTLSADERMKGYQRALKDHKIKYFKTIKRERKYNNLIEFGYQKALNILKDPNRPEAIICYADHMALGVLRAANKLNIKIPEDIALVGFGNNQEAAYLFPSLTTIQEDGYLVGKNAMKIMAGLLTGKRPQKNHITIETELVIRNST